MMKAGKDKGKSVRELFRAAEEMPVQVSSIMMTEGQLEMYQSLFEEPKPKQKASPKRTGSMPWRKKR